MLQLKLWNGSNTVGFVSGMCSIAYEPCDENSFKIGPPVLSGETRIRSQSAT